VFETLLALGEPNRFRIVELLRAGPQPVGLIGDALGMRQPQVSKHLQVLKAAGIVDVRAAAQQRHYELKGEPLRALHAWLEQYRELWDARFDAIDRVVEDLKQRDQRARKSTSAKKEKRHARKAK
jgi:DNA-binding transcriptional ArsR family regulator